MKKLSAVAVAVCLFVGAAFAGWDKFGVIDDGAAEMKLGYYGGWWLGVRYGLMENLELYSTMSGVAETEGLSSDYVVGARYQIIPVLGVFADIAVPTMKESGSYDFGLCPGINFNMNFSDKLSFGSVIQAGITPATIKEDDLTKSIILPNRTNPLIPDTTFEKMDVSATVIDFKVGIEFDYMFSDNIGMWVGVDFVYDDMTNSLTSHKDIEIPDPNDPAKKITQSREFDAAGAVKPGFGFFFTKDNLTVGTLLEFNLAHPTGEYEQKEITLFDGSKKNVDDLSKPKKGIGLSGGVEFCIKF